MTKLLGPSRGGKHVKAVGVNLILIDCDPGYAAWWNRWYDMDHLAEFLGLPGVVAARRYVATDDLIGTRVGPEADGLGPGQAAYCTIVFVGPDAEGAAAGRAGMAATHNRLFEVPGRMPDWERITPRYIEGFDLANVAAAATVPVTPDALLHLGHGGVLVELIDAEDQEAAEHWLDAVHIPRLLSLPGVLAAARFQPVSLPAVEAPWAEGDDAATSTGAVRLFLLVLIEPDPASVAPGLKERSDSSVAGLSSVPGTTRSFHGVFRTITAPDYDFLGEQVRGAG
jgi:hypothetical protein